MLFHCYSLDVSTNSDGFGDEFDFQYNIVKQNVVFGRGLGDGLLFQFFVVYHMLYV